jgi:hypothetical protein
MCIGIPEDSCKLAKMIEMNPAINSLNCAVFFAELLNPGNALASVCAIWTEERTAFELGRQLLKLGNAVAVTGRDASQLKEARRKLPGLKTIQSDVGNPSAIRTLYEQVAAEMPELHRWNEERCSGNSAWPGQRPEAGQQTRAELHARSAQQISRPDALSDEELRINSSSNDYYRGADSLGASHAQDKET